MLVKLTRAEKFAKMERSYGTQPAGGIPEIAAGVFHVAARVEPLDTLTRLIAIVEAYCHADAGEWLCLTDPELRREEIWTRMIPDIAVWGVRRGGWPNPNEDPFSTMPFWAAEVLIPETEAFDRGAKMKAYGLMRVPWVWLVDPRKKRVEIFENVEDAMLPRTPKGTGKHRDTPPFDGLGAAVAGLFAA
ncbi:MAG TPA: Uma2 family endonuclease [Thermoanaerobaculia bacterium]